MNILHTSLNYRPTQYLIRSANRLVFKGTDSTQDNADPTQAKDPLSQSYGPAPKTGEDILTRLGIFSILSPKGVQDKLAVNRLIRKLFSVPSNEMMMNELFSIFSSVRENYMQAFALYQGIHDLQDAGYLQIHKYPFGQTVSLTETGRAIAEKNIKALGV